MKLFYCILQLFPTVFHFYPVASRERTVTTVPVNISTNSSSAAMMKKEKPEVSSTLEAMLIQETSFYLTSDYSFVYPFFSNLKHRQTMIKWMFLTQQQVDYTTDTVEFAVNIWDRYLLTEHGEDALKGICEYQLSAVTSFYLAAKTQEERVMSPETLTRLLGGNFTANDVENMEGMILTALEWRINPPTSLAFVEELVTLLPLDEHTRENVRYTARRQCELALLTSDYLPVKMSLVAIAAVSNALEILSVDSNLLALAEDAVDLFMKSNRDASLLQVKKCLYEDYSSSSCRGHDKSIHKTIAGQIELSPSSPRSIME